MRATDGITIHTSCWADPGWISLSTGAQHLYLAMASAPIPRDAPLGDWVALLGPHVADAMAELQASGALDGRKPTWTHVCTNRCTTRPVNRPHIPAAVRSQVYERDGHRCVTCGATKPLSLDHIVPFSLGGSDDPSNLQTMCRPCNSRKGARV